MRYADFTNLFSLQKTLRFELIPQGVTEQKIREARGGDGSTLLERDTKRALKYKEAKKIIDIYHRHHIEEALSLVDFKSLGCESHLEFLQSSLFVTDFSGPEEKERAAKDIADSQAALRKAIASVLQGSIEKKAAERFSKKQRIAIDGLKERFKLLSSHDLFDGAKNLEFRDVVAQAAGSESEFESTINFFKGFATYFTGFNENRENMYSDGNEVTGIANRIVHENLPRFLDNIRIFEKVKTQLSKEVWKKMKDDLGLLVNPDVYFKLNYFQHCLNQAGIDQYNLLIGGKFEEGAKEKRQGLNEKINLFNQNHPDARLPRLRPLYKQILSESSGTSFRPEPFESDHELLTAIKDFWNDHIKNAIDEKDQSRFDVLLSFAAATKQFKTMKEDVMSGVFVDGKRLSALSHQAFGEWVILRDALREKYLHDHSSESESKRERGLTSYLAKPYFSLAELETALSFFFNQVDEGESLKNRTTLCEFFHAGLFVDTVTTAPKNQSETPDETVEVERGIVATIEAAYRDVRPLLDERGPVLDQLHKDKEKVSKIKGFLDSLKTLQRHLAYLRTEASSTEKNEGFYSLWESCYEVIEPLNPLYNKVRNRLTRKPFSEEKLKLNFDQSTLLAGWDVNKEIANLSVILEREGLYYLAIMEKSNNHLFETIPTATTGDYYNKLNYKLLPGPNKMLPKVFFSAKRLETYRPGNKILVLYKNGSFKLGDGFILKDLHTLIDFYKDAITKNKDWAVFQFRFRPTEEYKNISEFYGEVETQGYKTWFSQIDSVLIDQFVAEGRLYLFQIYNKDFSRYSKGRPNLHTIYWRNLFEEGNRKEVVYKLNGEAEVFFRPASIEYSPEKRREGHHAEGLKGKFDYPILKDRRYSVDKFHFHVPITLNFRSGNTENINPLVHPFLRTAENIKVIGIDRGERHLLYLSLIDEKGKIITQTSLNSVHNEKANVDIDFHAKLDAKERERQKARQSWDVIENIKELKEGYLSLIVHRIAEIMVKEQAVLVMEDLNFGFKRGRFKVEKQVYQKFEKMLIDKLNYLVFKDKKPEEPGGSLNALQLASKFESFQKLGKQSGMIFYVPAAYTSKIDPVTGFFNFLNPKPGNIAANQAFFSRFDSIRYNVEKGYFEFHASYGRFVQSAADSSKSSKGKKSDPYAAKLASKTWVICSHTADRYRFRRSKNGSVSFEPFDCNAEFKSLLEKAGIAFGDGEELRDRILAKNDASFFKGMIEGFRILIALRYNNGKKGKEERDYIVSPVADPKTGGFFNSQNAGDSLPIDADANGAFHIARKGLLLIDRIRKFEAQEKKKFPDLFLSHNEWLHSLWFGE